MKTEIQTPPPYLEVEYDSTIIEGNREGFINLKSKIETLLHDSNEYIPLYDTDNNDNHIDALKITEFKKTEEISNSWGEKILVIILISIPIFWLIGIIKSLIWFISLF